MGASQLTTAAATRHFPGEVVSGDAWTVERSDTMYRLTVIDGLGHGPEAAEAAALAKRTLQSHPDLEPIAALMACHHAMDHTRGAAILTAQIDLTDHRLTYAGVGNVEGRLCLSDRDHRLISFRGIVGTTVGKVSAFTLDLPGSWMLILHTDGISARFDTPALVSGNWQDLAHRILDRWGRTADDATVVVVGPAGQ
jgi:serine phosphatase RsbU (regulator of sigma subunit)